MLEPQYDIMKKIILILFLMPSIWNGGVKGQITSDSGDLPVVGDVIPSAKDVIDPLVITFNVGSAGVNQVWNYSTLVADQLVNTNAVAPNTTPYSASFPNSNLAYTSDFVEYLFNNLTAQANTIEGFSGDVGIGVHTTVSFSNTYDQYRFPIVYLGAYTDDYAFTEIIPFGNLPASLRTLINDELPPGVDATRVRLRFSATLTFTVDAWGTVITPLGSYDCLRYKKDEVSTTRIDVEVDAPFVGKSWENDAQVTNSNITDYQWLTKVTKLPVITLDYDSDRNIIGVNYSLIPPVPNANFTYVEGASGSVIFTNTSENSPTSYAWDFGDGNLSTAPNPTNVYVANGTYNVCLTAINATGNHVFLR